MPTKKPTDRKRSHGVSHGQGDARKRRRGAQPGNVNALRSGKRSKRLRKLIVALIADREVRSIVLALAAAKVEDNALQLDQLRFLYRVTKLKQEMRRDGAFVDKRTRSRAAKGPPL